MRGERPFIFTNLKANQGVAEIAQFILTMGGVETDTDAASAAE